MNRLERLSAILVQLQSGSVVTAQQIADRFDISLRTVYRDIRTLEEAGIPIIGNTGIGYSLVDGYKLPPLMFTREEAIAFLTAEKLVEKMTDLQNISAYKSGMSKIKAVLRYIEKDYLSDIEDNISILGKSDISADLPSAITQCVLKSIAEQRVMHISYMNGQEQESERDVEPVGCFYSQISWYMIAYCTRREEYRNFRIDRIKSFLLKDVSFSKRHLTLPQYLEKHKIKDDVYEVVIKISNTDMAIVNDYKCYHGWLKEDRQEGCTLMYFRVFDVEHFARWFVSFADIAEIMQPEMLKGKVNDRLESIKAKMG